MRNGNSTKTPLYQNRCWWLVVFRRNYDFNPIFFNFCFSNCRRQIQTFRFGFLVSAFHASMDKTQLPRFCFSRFNWQIPIFTPLLFTPQLANSNFQVSAFHASTDKTQFSSFCFSHSNSQVAIFIFLIFAFQS